MSRDLESVRVTISPTALAGIEKRARARVKRFEAAEPSRAVSGDGELLHRNVRGVAGEQAVLRWLQNVLNDTFAVRDAADAPDGPSDLEVITSGGVLGIEIKTTTYDHWLRFGRAIDVDQLWTTDAKIYVWCAGSNDSKPREIHIVGWSTTADLRRTTLRSGSREPGTFRRGPSPWVHRST